MVLPEFVVIGYNNMKCSFSEDKPMPVANYLEFGSELKVKVDLAFPLNASEKDVKAVETTSQVDEVFKT